MRGPGVVGNLGARLVGEGGSAHLSRSVYSLMANTILTGALGVAFWIVAARLFSHDAVGRDSALISAMIALSAACQLNLTNVFTRFLSHAMRPTRLIALGYAAAAGLSLLAGAAAVVILPDVSASLGFIGDDPRMAAVWVASVSLWSVFALQDAALTGLRQAPWVPLENAVFGVCKLALLIPFVVTGAANGVFLAWVLPMAILLVPVNWIVFRRAIPAVARYRKAPRVSVPELFGRARLRRFLALDYVSSVFTQGIATSLPLIVVALLGTEQNAYYYVAFSVAVTLDLLSSNIATSLTVEGGFAGGRVPAAAGTAVRRFAILLGGATLLVVVAAPLFLLPFGRSYADHASGILRLLALATIPRGILFLYTAICRTHGHGGRIAILRALQFVMVLTLTITLGAEFDLLGIGLGWLIANVAPAVVLLPSVIRHLRSPRAARA